MIGSGALEAVIVLGHVQRENGTLAGMRQALVDVVVCVAIFKVPTAARVAPVGVATLADDSLGPTNCQVQSRKHLHGLALEGCGFGICFGELKRNRSILRSSNLPERIAGTDGWNATTRNSLWIIAIEKCHSRSESR